MLNVPDIEAELDQLENAPDPARRTALIDLTRRAIAARAVNPALTRALVAELESGEGEAAVRLELGEVLGHAGDPRLSPPDQDSYWVRIAGEDGPITIGRYPVTNQEYRRFVHEGGYEREELWTEAGQAWLQKTVDPWPVKAEGEDAAPYVVANQPVVGVSWHEAAAYARWAQARLLQFDERLVAVRGPEKRPYPWGSPFGSGNANTREEVLGRPCAVGLYLADRTPEGVCDLAGNVAEWTEDGAGDERWCHPGSWAESFESTWAKARELHPRGHRAAHLGFRLAR